MLESGKRVVSEQKNILVGGWCCNTVLNFGKMWDFLCVFISIVAFLGSANNSAESKAGLYEKCNTTNDCSQTTDGRTTQCLHGVCLCEYGYRPTPDKHNCVLQAGLGETCNTTEDCMQARNNISTECWKDTCACQTGFKPTPGMRDCVRVVIGDTCENNRECYVTNGTRTCDKNVCQCDPSFVRSKKNNNTCLKVAELNAFCEEDHQCMAENVRCDVPRCVCKKGYKWENSKCVSSQAKLTTSKLWLAPVLFVAFMMWL